MSASNQNISNDRGHSSYRGRGRGNRNNYGGTWKLTVDDSMPLTTEDLPKGGILAELEVAKLVEAATEEQFEAEKYRKEDYELVASYNWCEKAGKPGIIVPGLAARWTPPSLPAWLNPDSGIFYIDQNAYRWPTSPLEPALRALFTLHPTFDLNPIDIVTDRNNLRKLFRFVCGNQKFMHEFKFYVEVINRTVLVTRWEKRAANVVAGGEFRGFGHTFEKEFTKYTKGLEGSTGHHRVAKYKFGGLNMMVRFTAEAFLGSKDMPSGGDTEATGIAQKSVKKQTSDSSPRTGQKSSPGRTRPHFTPGTGDVKQAPPSAPAHTSTTNARGSFAKPLPKAPLTDHTDLADIFAKSLKIEANNEPENPPHRLEIVLGGMMMPQERVLEMKTRAMNRTIDLTDQTPQLWFSNTSNLYVGYHQRGSFMNVDTEIMGVKGLQLWEDENQGNLRKLAALLRSIIQIARSAEGGRAQVACVGGKLRVHAIQDGEEAFGTLPMELRQRWDVQRAAKQSAQGGVGAAGKGI
ncbi:hypothetical protein L211DRAFT_833071 [Terfezia boudieri ATCC MYA-4762]|uniref:Geranylgeranyl pyrophosphate synthetase n=1 Tax=Terfezia boudieri ATCC MYA-4762 TaxID=1051890 RepID=A0A3N4M640_9PEZI|nr:hypothetical protein L211DRAFT_833071 [Terfezia boudieri ATCC MYA-4762]